MRSHNKVFRRIVLVPGAGRRALETWEREYGPEHPKLAAFLNNQATLRLAQGEVLFGVGRLFAVGVGSYPLCRWCWFDVFKKWSVRVAIMLGHAGRRRRRRRRCCCRCRCRRH